MSAYDYGNARLRAMKSRLLSQREVEAMAGLATLDSLIAALSKTAYRKHVETALARSSGMECIVETLRNDLVHTLAQIRTFYTDDAQQIIILALQIYDVHNLKTILRGLAKNAPPADILSNLLPIGDLTYSICLELVRAPGPRGVIDLLASMGFPLARPLMQLRHEHPDADTSEMELALDQWHFSEAEKALQDIEGEELFLRGLKLEADLVNLIMVLRFTYTPEERKMLHQWLGSDELKRVFVGPGMLVFDLLTMATNQETIEGAVEILSGTPYGPALRAGLADFGRSRRLSDFEKHLNKFRLDWMSQWIARDPLGIGVFLGYVSLKVNEIKNLTWIAQGIQIGLPADSIRAELKVAV